MDQDYIVKLRERDIIEGRFNELFRVPKLTSIEDIGKSNADSDSKNIVDRLRKELRDKEVEIKSLREVIDIKNKNAETLNNELISLNIENNLIGEKYSTLEDEHEKLVKRWLERVHQEFDFMNAN